MKTRIHTYYRPKLPEHLCNRKSNINVKRNQQKTNTQQNSVAHYQKLKRNGFGQEKSENPTHYQTQ